MHSTVHDGDFLVCSNVQVSISTKPLGGDVSTIWTHKVGDKRICDCDSNFEQCFPQDDYLYNIKCLECMKCIFFLDTCILSQLSSYLVSNYAFGKWTPEQYTVNIINNT